MSMEAMTWAFAQTVSGNDKLVLLALADYADEVWSCYPAHKTIATKASVSERTVRNSLDRLREAGLLRWELRHSETTGYRTSNRYILQPEPEGLKANVAGRPNGKISVPTGNLLPLEVNPQLEPRKEDTRARETPIPDDWEPREEHQVLATERGVNLAEQAEMFKLHAQTHDRRAVRWNAAFTMWLKKATPSRQGLERRPPAQGAPRAAGQTSHQRAFEQTIANLKEYLDDDQA